MKSKSKKNTILKSKYLIWIISILFFFIYIFLTFSFLIEFIKINYFESGRRNSIPLSAEWHGGVDGGHWFNLLEEKDNIFIYEIFNDVGEKIVSAEYILDCNCVKVDTLGNRINNYIISMNNIEEIYLNIICNHQYCKLKLIKYLIKDKNIK